MVVPARQAAKAGGIDSLESILWLLKSLTIVAPHGGGGVMSVDLDASSYIKA